MFPISMCIYIRIGAVSMCIYIRMGAVSMYKNGCCRYVYV